MILKLTLCGLCILLVAVIAISYYTIEEGFVKKLDDKYNVASPPVVPPPEVSPPVVPPPVVPPPEVSPPAPPAPLPAIPLPPVSIPTVTIQSLQLPANAKLQGESQPAPISLPNASVLAAQSSAPPRRNDVAAEVSVSDTGYTAMALQQKSDLLKDIQKIFRNELLANRATEPMGQASHTRHAASQGPTNGSTNDSPSTAQGIEYGASSVKGNHQGCSHPDMSQYIKKDAIPCWGCSLDY